MPNQHKSDGLVDILQEAKNACDLYHEFLERALEPLSNAAPLSLSIALDNHAEERLQSISTSMQHAHHLLAGASNRKKAYTVLTSASESHCDALRWSHLGDWIQLASKADDNARRAANELANRKERAIRRAEEAREDVEELTRTAQAIRDGTTLEPDVVASLRDCETLALTFFDTLPDTIESMYKALATFQEQTDKLIKKEAKTALRTARWLFLKLRVKYQLLTCVGAVPYVLAVLLSFVCAQLPSFSAVSSGYAAFFLLAISAVIKRFVSTEIGARVDKNLALMVDVELRHLRRTFVLVEATLAAHQGLQSYMDTFHALDTIPLTQADHFRRPSTS